jgi:hypothetical protein
MTNFPNTTRTTELLSLNMEKERIGYGLVTTATAYKKGDLLALSEANVLTHATDEKTWDVICERDISAAQATAMATAGSKTPIYIGGDFNVEYVSLAGVKLTTAKYAAAQAKATKNRINLLKV